MVRECNGHQDAGLRGDRLSPFAPPRNTIDDISRPKWSTANRLFNEHEHRTGRASRLASDPTYSTP